MGSSFWTTMVIGWRQAADEYLAGLPYPTFLHRTDYTGRVFVKQENGMPSTS